MRTLPSGIAPMNWLTGLPSLKAMTVGSEETLTKVKDALLQKLRGAYLELLREDWLCIRINSNEIERLPAPSRDAPVRCELLQDGGDHLARPTPAVRDN